MALTRRLLKEVLADREDMNELIDTIIDAHLETVAGLKAQISTLEGQAAEAKRLAEELERLGPASPEDTVYKAKYEKLMAEFEAARAEEDAKDAYREKQEAYRYLLRQAGVPDRVAALALRDRDTIERLEVSGGKIRDHESVLQEIRRMYGEFVPNR